MNISILGTGQVGQVLAEKLVAVGHQVVIGTRNPQATLARTDKDHFGNPSYAVWAQSHPEVKLVSLAEAAKFGTMVLNATAGSGSLESLTAAGEENLAGKVLIDIANPLDFSKGMPPSLFVSNTDSLGEQIQKAFPKTKVVKTLNIVSVVVMVNPDSVKAGQPTMFVSGNDSNAKAEVTKFLEKDLGWKDVIDLGDITTARGTEMLLPIWLRTWNFTQSPFFGFKVMR